MRQLKTVAFVDLRNFLGTWYVTAGRTPPREQGAHNSVKSFRWNSRKRHIDELSSFRIGSFDSANVTVHKRTWIKGAETQTLGSVRPRWPLRWPGRIDYLVLALARDYSWAAIGTTNKKYLWVLSQIPEMPNSELSSILATVELANFPVQIVNRIPQKHAFADLVRMHSLETAA